MKNFLTVIILLLCVIPRSFAGNNENIGLGKHLIGRVITSDDTLKSRWIEVDEWDTFNLFFDFGGFTDSTAVLIAYWITDDQTIAKVDTTSQGYFKLNTGAYTVLDSIVTADSVNNGKLWLSVTGTSSLSPGVASGIQFLFMFGTDHDSLTIDSEPQLLRYGND